MECRAQRTDSLHTGHGCFTAAFVLKSNNSHRLLISCTCTTQTIRRPTCTRSSSTTAFGSTAGFARNTAGGELGRLAEHPPPHKPHTLLTKLMWSARKAQVFRFPIWFIAETFCPVCTLRFQGTDGSIFHERPPDVRFEVRHEPPITGIFKFRSTSRRRTTNVYNSTVRVHFAIQSKTDQQ